MATKKQARWCDWECGRQSGGGVCKDCLRSDICRVCGGNTDPTTEDINVCLVCGTIRSHSWQVENVQKAWKQTADAKALESLHRLKRHMRDVGMLLIDYDQVTLVVGPQKARMTCHRALLGYHSEFFDNALYGKFTEGSPDAVMNLPVMMSSMYGIHPMDIYRSATTEELWIFADKIFAPKFANDIMQFLLMKYVWYPIPPATAELVFQQTLPGSKIRMFIKKLIGSNGPFGPRMNFQEEYRQEWLAVLARGGDLVTDCMLAGGFHDSGTDFPSDFPRCLDYVQDEGKATVSDWWEKKAYAGDKSERTLR